MNVENVFPHTLAKNPFLNDKNEERERALIIRKMYFKSSKDVSGTLLRGIKPAFVKSCFRSLYREINICYSNQKFLPLNLESSINVQCFGSQTKQVFSHKETLHDCVIERALA